MSAPSATVVLRASTPADHELLVDLYGSTREQELAQVGWAPGERDAFVRMQFAAQDADYRMRNPHASFDVVEVAGRPAGRLYVDRREAEIRIVDIALLPQFRGLGVGSGLIGRLQSEAAECGKPLTIHVEVHNPAALLYERLGFRPVSERGLYRRMEWRTT